MAEGVLIGATKSLLGKLASQSTLDFFLKWDLDHSLLKEFQIQHNSVHGLLGDAESKHVEEDLRVTKWLEEARFVIYDAEDLLDDIFTDINKVRYRLGDSPRISDKVREKVKYKWKDFVKTIHPLKQTREAEMKVIIQRLKFQADQKDVLGLRENVGVIPLRKNTNTSLVSDTFGRVDEIEEIKKLLSLKEGSDNTFRAISIIGIGGLGKTTLAKKVYDAYGSINSSAKMINSKVGFEVKGWVCVSNEFDASKVIKLLLENITGKQSKNGDNLDLNQRQLEGQLQGKRFLLVLDDMWSDRYQDWESLRKSFIVGASGSRVIVTTRNIKVARLMCSETDIYRLSVLPEEDCWKLFQNIVFPNEPSFAKTTLEEIGKKVVRRCKGLPLAVKMLGGLLKSEGNDEKI